ncbi:metal-dependent transcriptional regulator [bacterium]|nr:metal-dependent transcriptional regulator [bacterium]
MANKTTEDYLKTIFWLSRLSVKVNTSAIAGGLKISSASVTDMLKRLSENGYITYTPYYGVRLTKKGDKLALKVIRRHRLLELFLVEALEYTWDNVHEEAERLEHVVSDELEARIDSYLGNPRYDPHGDPIPSNEGVMEELAYCKLSELNKGEQAIVSQVIDSKQLLRYMKKLNLALQSRVAVKEKESFDGSMKVKIDGKEEHFLSRDVTKQIFVKKIK